MLVREVTAADVQRAVTKWTGKLAANTVRKVLKHTSAMCTGATHAERCVLNPVKVTKRPEGAKSKIEVYSPAELAKIITGAPPTSTGVVIATLAASGCRMGEALALDVPDWNPTTGKLSITKTYERRWGSGRRRRSGRLTSRTP